VDFELRRECHSVTLVQVPLALGVMYLAPPAHLAARLLAPLLLGLWQRQAPLKVLFNVASAAFEVGAAALAVSLVAPDPGPALWVALYVGLLVGDVVGTLTLSAVWWLVGMPVTQRTPCARSPSSCPVTLVFTALSIVTLSAVRDERAVWVVLLVLAGDAVAGVPHAPQGRGPAAGTQRLYDFVKDLGPLDLGSRAALVTLERMRPAPARASPGPLAAARGHVVPPGRTRRPRAAAVEDRAPGQPDHLAAGPRTCPRAAGAAAARTPWSRRCSRARRSPAS
jgi:hypothetical protein